MLLLDSILDKIIESNKTWKHYETWMHPFYFLLDGRSKEEPSKLIKVAVSPTIPPMMFEKDGEYSGIDSEIFEGYRKSRGCTFKVTAYD